MNEYVSPNRNSLENLVPVNGFWLADAPEPYRNFCFNILDIANYPFKRPFTDSKSLHDEVFRLKPIDVHLKCIDLNDPKQREAFHKALWIMREKVSWGENLPNPLPNEKHNGPIYRASKELIQKRLFFLHVAKQVVAGLESPSSIACRYGLDKINVKIWTTILLAHGEDVFYEKEKYIPFQREKAIVESYRMQKNKNIARTCANNLIFTHNRFKHMLKRHPAP